MLKLYDEKIDDDIIEMLTEQDLKDFGVDAKGDRLRILNRIRETNKTARRIELAADPATSPNALQRIEDKLEQLMEQRIAKKLEQLMEKLDKDHNKLADLEALFLVRNVSQLMVQVLNKINTRGQFKSSIFCPDQKGKKIKPSISQPLEPYTYEKYVKDKSDLVIIDKKIAKPRNLKGHPISSLKEIPAKDFENDLRLIQNLKIISDTDVDVLVRLGKFVLRE